MTLHAICHWLGHTRLGHWLELDHSPSLQWLGRCPCKSCQAIYSKATYRDASRIGLSIRRDETDEELKARVTRAVFPRADS